MYKSLLASFSFHSLCCAVFIGFTILSTHKKFDNSPHLEKIIDVSFEKDTSQLENKNNETVKPKIITDKITTNKPFKKIYHKKKSTKIFSRIIKKQNNKPIVNKVYITDINNKNNFSLNHNKSNKNEQKKISFNENYYITLVKQKIASKKFYPINAKRRAIEGRTLLELSINTNGNIRMLRIIQSSGSTILDNAAIQSVHSAIPFKTVQKIVTFQFAMNFNLLERQTN